MTNYNFYLRFFAFLKSKYLYFLIFSCVTSWQSLTAQTPAIVWQKSFGGSDRDEATAIQQTTDGGYIVAGSSLSVDGDVTGNYGNGYADYWVVKLDAEGTLLWEKCLGGSETNVANAIQQTTDGGYIVAGYSAAIDIDGGEEPADYWVVKLDANGNLLWQRSLGGSDSDLAYAIQQTTDGGYIVAGYSGSNDGDVTGNHGGPDYWIVKLDASGNLLWQRSLGGSFYDFAYAIQQTTDGGYIVAGSSSSIDGDVTGHHGSYDYWVVKLDAAGTLTWQKSFGGSDYEDATDIQQCADGGYIMVGRSSSIDGDVTGNHGGINYWIVKLVINGDIDWQKNLGGSDIDIATSIQQCADGGYIVAGYSYSKDGEVTGNHGIFDYWIVKLNTEGTLLWQKCLGGSNGDNAYSIQQCRDGGYIIAGWSGSIDGDVTGNHGGSDYWVVKLKDYAVGTSGLGGLIVYPNPVVGNTMQVEYYLSAATEVEIRIIDILGKCVWCGAVESEAVGVHSRELDVAGLASGLYFLEVRTRYGAEIVRWVKG